jgi:hypothetical protein
MKAIPVSKDSAEISALLEQARTEDVIVRLADGTEFIISAVDDFDIEIARTRQNEKLMALLDERAKQTQTVSIEEVQRQLGLSDR